jgi:hypothetical protein
MIAKPRLHRSEFSGLHPLQQITLAAGSIHEFARQDPRQISRI